MTHPNPFRVPIHPEIDEALIATLVDRFYERVRADPVLGPIFNRVIPEERWPHHLQLLRDFWSSITMMTGRYKGMPLPVHQRIGGLTPAHFERWLSLWRTTAAAECPPEVAQLFVERAERIARSLQYGLSNITRNAPPAATGAPS